MSAKKKTSVIQLMFLSVMEQHLKLKSDCQSSLCRAIVSLQVIQEIATELVPVRFGYISWFTFYHRGFRTTEPDWNDWVSFPTEQQLVSHQSLHIDCRYALVGSLLCQGTWSSLASVRLFGLLVAFFAVKGRS